MKICYHVIVTQQWPTVEQLLRSFANSESVSCASAVWVSYRQTNCHCRN